MRNTVIDMLADDLLAKSAQSGFDSRKLNQDIRSVFIGSDHLLDVLQMTDHAGNAVDLPFDLCRVVGMSMCMQMLHYLTSSDNGALYRLKTFRSRKHASVYSRSG